MTRRRSVPWYNKAGPLVSIIIPAFNNAALTCKCLEALWEHTTDVPYEIIVVDNGSAAHEVEILKHLDGPLRLMPLSYNAAFGKSCNLGASIAKGQFVLFLNNDVFVSPNWLKPMVEMLDVLGAGAVGARLLNADGSLQEAGSFLYETGVSIQTRQDNAYHSQEPLQSRIVDYCSAACLAVPSQLFSELGGFDPTFYPAYFEDADLCLRIAARGLFVYCCVESAVIHLRNATSAVVWPSDEHKDIAEKNRQRFVARWGPWLAARANNSDGGFPVFDDQAPGTGIVEANPSAV